LIHTTLDGLIARVLQEDARKYDLLADTRRMSVSEHLFDLENESDTKDVLLSIDGDGSDGIEELRLSDHALGQMATDLGIPKRYFDRMRDKSFDLFRTNVHHWLYQEPNRRMVRAYRDLPTFTQDGHVAVNLDKGPATGRAWLSDRYRRLDNVEIATKLLPEFDRLSEEVQFHNAAITDTKFYLRAVFPRLTAEIKVGDAVQWGVQIRNSEVGAGTFAIESFVNRLVCMNGMVVSKILNARHIGKRLDESLSDEAIQADDHAFWLAARDVLRASISEVEFEKVVATLRETTDGEQITAPIAATERLAKAYSLSDGEKEAVLLSLAANGDFSRWGALNAVTATAQSSDSFDRRVELEEIGWSIADLAPKEWSRIAVST
jgi:hypothetical protein